MVTVLRVMAERTRCPHCAAEIDQVWVMKYESTGLRRFVLLCTQCEGVIPVIDGLRIRSEQSAVALNSRPA